MDEMDISWLAGEGTERTERRSVWNLLEDHDQPDWQEKALCAQTDPEAFFPEKGGSTREAKRICAGCEVRAECLEYALAFDERFGIWGGLSERERRRLKRGVV
jgi:WhiB family redox-sensing transcriptional regulator